MVRPALESDLPDAASLLPWWHFFVGDQILVAEAPSPRRIVGAAVWRPSRLEERPVALADFSLVRRFAESDIVDGLIHDLLTGIQAQGVKQIYLSSPRRDPSPVLSRLKQHGFSEEYATLVYEFRTGQPLLERIERVFDILRRRKAIPSDAAVTGLTPEHWPGITRLLRSENIGQPLEMAAAEKMGLHRYYSPCSSVLLQQNEVKGVILVRMLGRVMELQARAVVPELRGGRSWANALLMHRTTSIAINLGAEVAILRADPERHVETQRFADSIGATQVGRDCFLIKNLDGRDC